MFCILAWFYRSAMTQADKEMDGNIRDDEALWNIQVEIWGLIMFYLGFEHIFTISES